MASSSSAPPLPPQPSNIPTLKFSHGEGSSSPAPPQSEILTLKSVKNEVLSLSEPQEKKILTLKSSDEDEFEVEESIAVQSLTIKNMVEDGYTLIPLLNVDSKILIKILDYMVNHHDEKSSDVNEEQLKEFDKEFVKISIKKMTDLVFAANYLNIPGLMNLLCQTFADKIKGKSVNAVRKIFNITNDYTTEEEAEVRREHEWAHEGEFDDTVEDYNDTSSEEEDEDEEVVDGESEEESDDDESDE